MLLEKLSLTAKDFIRCGSAGWCFEVFFTGLGSVIHHDKKMMGVSSLHMFPIYGIGAIIRPVHKVIKKLNILVRGIIYAIMIYITEFTSGMLLKRRGACPWDYSKAKLNYKGIIRLDYLPLWFIVGLIYEKMLE